LSYNFQIKQQKKSRDYRKPEILDTLSSLNPMMDRSFVNDINKAPNKDLIESDPLMLSEMIDNKSSKENDFQLLQLASKIDSKKNSHPGINQLKAS